LPSDSELKDQLGKIYLKDQLDRDKQELRLFKEMYLKDGELDEKDKHARRKQFRWKHLDNENDNHNMFSSDEDEEEEEDENEDDNNGTNEKDENKLKEKSKKFVKKLLDKRNWRSIRHEREQLIDSKNKKDLLSDHEQDNNEDDEIIDDSNSSNSQSKDFLFSSSINTNNSNQQNQLIKKGQMLLKQNKNIQQVDCSTTNNGNNSETFDHLKKFSFLNRDKTYLNRLSNYVNKNIYCNSGTTSKSTRSNMMVFSSIDINSESNTTVDNKDDVKQVIRTTTTSTIRSVKVNSDGGSEAKRIKMDNCESIFNHL
jgi:hypothetical protein